jgi:triacylglycerol lipase
MSAASVVLHHGLFGHGELRFGPFTWEYFHRIGKAIAARGYSLLSPGVHPTAGVATRAAQLKDVILARFPSLLSGSDRIVIIAHSMGGLDARYMISRLGMARHVAALVTVCTPHRGSPYADWVLRHVGEKLGGLWLMDALNLDFQALADLTTDNCRRFNETTPDSPDVAYMSVAGCRALRYMPPWAIHSWHIIHGVEGDNDGLVSVKSAPWGDFLATWPADHWHAINRRLKPPWVDPQGDIAPRYLEIIRTLEARGLLRPEPQMTKSASA